MARTTITVDGITILDENLGDWMKEPPPDLKALLERNHAEPKPWIKPVMVTLVDCLLTNHPVTITITTHPPGWSMDVST